MARPGRRQNGTLRIRHGAGLREKPHQRRAKAVALCMLRHCEKPGYRKPPDACRDERSPRCRPGPIMLTSAYGDELGAARSRLAMQVAARGGE